MWTNQLNHLWFSKEAKTQRTHGMEPLLIKKKKKNKCVDDCVFLKIAALLT